jgi:Flp pilus assembly pilin Flp
VVIFCEKIITQQFPPVRFESISSVCGCASLRLSALQHRGIVVGQRTLSLCALIPAVIRDRRAVTALEYAIIGAIIVATVVIGFTNLSAALSNQFTTIGAGL